ncbi:hypothetical protein MRB53_010261 [Persea americana]|uniref:Uncharacterized protein n=1 Tax=Persea americana TaxID=3435 RepID=A0ACC2LRB6_PERAE|nr:hypothetical protein MRB53_010261 [Persea americana]
MVENTFVSVHSIFAFIEQYYELQKRPLSSEEGGRDKDADLSVKIKEGFGPSGLGIISVSDGITTYEYVVAMRTMSEAPAGSIDDDNQNVIYSPSGSATTGFSGGSSLGLQYKGAWCTPPRVFVDHQLRTLQGGHRALVGSLYWNKHILTIGGKDLMIIDNDVIA